MKTIISILATMALAFFYGTAFAAHEQGKYQSTDDIDAYRTFAHSDEMTDAAAGGLRAEPRKSSAGWDKEMRASFESTDVPDPYKVFAEPEIIGVTGVAAGGLRAEKTGPSAGGWDNLKASFESTDVPDPYKGFAK